MSDSLHDIETAIQAHMAATFEGEYVDSWVVVLHAQTLTETGSNYRVIAPLTQAHHVDTGLLAVGERILSDVWDWEDDDD